MITVTGVTLMVPNALLLATAPTVKLAPAAFAHAGPGALFQATSLKVSVALWGRS